MNLWNPAGSALCSVGLPHPFGITLFEDDIFWTDWHTKTINRVNRLHVDNSVHAVHTRLHYPMDIQVYHPQRQPTSRMSAVLAGSVYCMSVHVSDCVSMCVCVCVVHRVKSLWSR